MPDGQGEICARSNCRETLLDAAEAAVLEKGFAATSIEELIAAVGITKSGFFYHFRDKTALAEALLRRYVAREDALFADLFARADDLDDDPLHGLLIALKFLAEMMADLPARHPGCLVAAYAYQDRQFNRSIRQLNRDAMERWRALFTDRIVRIAERYPPRAPVDLAALADMITVLIEGGLVVGKVIGDSQVTAQQIIVYRQMLRELFRP